MVFSSLTFLFLYLPLTLLVYFLSPLRWRNFVLLVVSLLFYGWGEPVLSLIHICMGFTIMESFMDRLVVRSTPGRGTTVVMRKRLAPRMQGTK